MRNSEILSCDKCGKVPEDILVVNCGHNLCLDCAAKRIHQTAKLGLTNYQTLLCERCEVPTILDPETANALIPKMPKSPSNPIRNSPRLVTPQKTYYPLNESDRFCKNHPREEVKYYCLDDLASPICAECVVAGLHKNHNLQNINNAIRIIQERLNDAIHTMSIKSEQLSSALQEFNKRKIALEELNNTQKLQTKSIFDDLRDRVTRKETELDLIANQDTDYAFKEMNLLEQQIDGRLQIISNNIDVIQSETKDSIPLNLLNFYSSNFETINQLVEIEKNDNIPSLDFIENYNMVNSNDININLRNQLQPIGDSIDRIQVLSRTNFGGIIRNPTSQFQANK